MANAVFRLPLKEVFEYIISIQSSSLKKQLKVIAENTAPPTRRAQRVASGSEVFRVYEIWKPGVSWQEKDLAQ